MVSDTFHRGSIIVTVLGLGFALLALAPWARAGALPQEDPPAGVEIVEERAVQKVAADAAGPEGVERGLAWLARAQRPDGFWPSSETGQRGTHGVGVSGLAILAFLGAGNTHEEGPHKQVVARGLKWLRERQDAEGCFASRGSPAFLYDHAIAALAMAEAYAMTQSAAFRKSAQAGVNFVLAAQNPYKGWRYGVRPGDNDTSITTWMVMVLKSAKISGLELNDQSLEWAHKFIDDMTDHETGRTGYVRRGERPVREEGKLERFPPRLSEACTAMGMLVRIFCGERLADSVLLRTGAELLEKRLPTWDPAAGSVDMIYWYFGTLTMYQVGGAGWRKWSQALREAVGPHQRTDGEMAGSWDPIGPWGKRGGRVYATALMTMCLEVWSRYSRVTGIRR